IFSGHVDPGTHHSTNSAGKAQAILKFKPLNLERRTLMTTKIKPIPDGFHTLTAYLTARRASDAIEFYKKAFGATELFRLNTPDGKIAHGEFKIGDSIFMISDENPGCGSASPETLNGSPVTLHLYVADADTTFSAAVKAGAKEAMPVANQFWGDRMGKLVDP